MEQDYDNHRIGIEYVFLGGSCFDKLNGHLSCIFSSYQKNVKSVINKDKNFQQELIFYFITVKFQIFY